MTGDLSFKVEERQFPELKVMYIPVTVPHAEMRQTRGYFMKLGLHAFARRGKATGDVFIRYVGETEETIEMEVCFGVEKFLPETKDIKAKTIEAYDGKFAVGYYKGPREELIDVYVAMGKWFTEQGLQRSGGPLIEYFLNDTRKFPASELLTELHWPLLSF